MTFQPSQIICCVSPQQQPNSDPLVEFGARLRAAREAKYGGRPAMSRSTGISDSTIVRVERGDRVSLEKLIAVGKALDIDPPADIINQSIRGGLERIARDATLAAAGALPRPDALAAAVGATAKVASEELAHELAGIRAETALLPQILAEIRGLSRDMEIVREYVERKMREESPA